jgi:hypothetical protein
MIRVLLTPREKGCWRRGQSAASRLGYAEINPFFAVPVCAFFGLLYGAYQFMNGEQGDGGDARGCLLWPMVSGIIGIVAAFVTALIGMAGGWYR